MTPLPLDNVKAMKFDSPVVIPATGYFTDAAWIRYGTELFPLMEEFGHMLWNGKSQEQIGKLRENFADYTRTDAWGCEWHYKLAGQEGVVASFPVKTREQMGTLEEPVEDEGVPHGFMFLRLTYLRGFPEFMIDLMEEPPELQHMIDTVVSYNMRQIRNRLAGEHYKYNEKTQTRLMWFGDDLGMQNALPMHPDTWRKYLKPCFKAMYDLCVREGVDVYMHTDGHIGEILPDLIECGVSVFNLQAGVDDMQLLRRLIREKACCLDMGLDRQQIPFWSPTQIDDHVRELTEELGDKDGGLWLKAELGPDIPLENCHATLAAMEKYRRVK